MERKKRTSKSFENTRSVIDNTTGEVVSSYSTITHTKPIDLYTKAFNGLSPGLKIGIDGYLLQWIEDNMGFANKGQQLQFGAKERAELAKEYGMSDRWVKKQISILVDRSILRRLKRGLFQVNPFVFGKGSIEEIAILRKQFLKETEDGKRNENQ